MSSTFKYERERLNRICKAYGSDKNSLAHTFAGYNYMDHYARLLYGRAVRTIIEFGVFKGSSLRMWQELFPSATIIGVDAALSKEVKNDPFLNNIYLYEFDQVDYHELSGLIKNHGRPELIIDDGSHAYTDIITTATYLIPRMAPHGLYVIEDTHVGWPMPSWPGMSETRYGPNKQSDLTEFIQAIRDGIDRMSGPVLGIHIYHGFIAFEIADEDWKPANY